jgi:hypothetical protein
MKLQQEIARFTVHNGNLSHKNGVVLGLFIDLVESRSGKYARLHISIVICNGM